MYTCVLLGMRSRSSAAIGNPAEFEGRTVESVAYDPPDQPLSSQDLQQAVTLRKGAPLRMEDVRGSIKSLFATGRYSNVEITAETAPAGVALVVHTNNQWFVGPVAVKGKTPLRPNRGQLANATRLQLGQAFSEDELQKAVDNLRAALERSGYYKTQIVPQVKREAQYQQVSFTFTVDKGKQARLEQPVVTGDTRLPPEKLAKATKYKGWFRWKLASRDVVQNGLRNMRNKYEKDDRLTATVVMQKLDFDAATNRVRPHIDAEGGPKVKIQTEGAKVSKGKLRRYVPVFDEGTVNRDLLVMGARNLRDYFQNIGYFDVEVDFEIEQSQPDRETIIYVVNLGQRHKLVQVTIQGNHYFKTEDLRERMYLQPAGFLRLRHGRYSEGFVRRDEDAIKALYQANGFQDVKVTSESLDDYKGKTGDVAVTLTITEGPQFKVSSLDMNGIKMLDESKITSMLASVPGEPFSENNVAMDRDYILRTYQSAGFPDAAFDWRQEPGPGSDEVRVHYIVTEGERKYVRDVLVTGIQETRPRLWQPNMRIKAGEPLSWTAMAQTQQNLYNLGVFDKVDMAIQNPDGNTDRKYVLYHIEEGHKYQMAVGLGAEIARIGGSQTSLDQPAGATGFAPRGSLDLSRLNLWGLGHSLNFKSRYSTLDRRVSLNYLAPRYRNVEGRNISFTALYDNTRDVRTFTARRLEGDVQYSQYITKALTGMWRYSYRDVRVDPGTLKISPLLIPLLSQPARIGEVSQSLIQDRRDDPADAHRGVYNTLDTAIANRGFASRRNFTRILARNSWYHPLPNRWILASNTQFGWIHPYSTPAGIDPSEVIPLPERFFGGGGTSHRGFPDNQAGPRDPETGFPLGGNALFFHTTEVRFPFIGENINGVLFHDMGNVYSSIGDISFRVHQRNLTDFNYMVHAAGFGIRYHTPVGPIRIDLAYSINPPSFHGLKGTYQQLLFGGATPTIQSVSHFQFFFSIGQAF